MKLDPSGALNEIKKIDLNKVDIYECVDENGQIMIPTNLYHWLDHSIRDRMQPLVPNEGED